jgi:uncharacterized protein YqgV (UPF0045/DUF77 family)
MEVGKITNKFKSKNVNVIDNLSDAVDGVVDILSETGVVDVVNNTVSILSGNIDNQINALQDAIATQQATIEAQAITIAEMQTFITNLTTPPL